MRASPRVIPRPAARPLLVELPPPESCPAVLPVGEAEGAVAVGVRVVDVDVDDKELVRG